MFDKEFLNTAPVIDRRLTRSRSHLIRRLKGYISTHYPDLTIEIYKFTFNKDESISYLNRHSDLPFIIRQSGASYVIDSRNLAGKIEHHLIDLSEEEPKISLQVMGVFAGNMTLKAHICNLIAQTEANEHDDAAVSYFPQPF
ncbi:hypothetical protein [Legionella shakespearei]|uniref:Uncharacterized protein n=1 Tax=Legionella shakespearei DSM 23087 TaxID=1122169 RepID=A0A0W0Z092_9GAMM|nr:hypothetical protein [Legionella shakespearei]KTD62287.1 hypothetical protein Lsha_0987 [Legionella shakespearei DSM 23087]